MNGIREFRSGDYRYTVENDEVTITQYTGNDVEVTVPGSIKGMPVIAIDSSAFHHCDNIKSVTIPDSVVRIGGLAFSKCYALEHVTLGRGIREIAFSPFSFCYKMIYNKYIDLKNKDNKLLYLFEVGNFFIFIDEDAKKVSELTNLKLTNFGRKSLNELKDNLKVMGLSFGMNLDGIDSELTKELSKKKSLNGNNVLEPIKTDSRKKN
jgi:hypothetical protein